MSDKAYYGDGGEVIAEELAFSYAMNQVVNDKELWAEFVDQFIDWLTPDGREGFQKYLVDWFYSSGYWTERRIENA